MSEERLSVAVLISGGVQGVGYRDWTQRTARSLRLDGWVRNRRDGRVEAVLSGPPNAVEAMLAQCRAGPPAANVAAVEHAAAELPEPGFKILPTV